MKPAFYYLPKTDYEAAVEGVGFDCLALSKTRRTDVEYVRVALVLAPPSIIDRAWDELTAEERQFLSPPWMAERVPTLEQVWECAKWLREHGEAAVGAATKLSNAVQKIRETPV